MDYSKDVLILADFGLSQSEIETYLACLKLGGAPASTVAKSVGAKRASIYATLRSLADKGFVLLYFKKGKRVYHAVDPHKLPRMYEKKLDVLQNTIPYLKSIEKNPIQPFGLRFIETRDELKQFYNESLITYKNKSYRAISNPVMWQKIDPDFFKDYRLRVGKANIKARLLLSADSKNKIPASQFTALALKYLPEAYPFKSTINIYDDKILIISPELTSYAVVIETPVMVDVFRSMFDIIWDSIS